MAVWVKQIALLNVGGPQPFSWRSELYKKNDIDSGKRELFLPDYLAGKPVFSCLWVSRLPVFRLELKPLMILSLQIANCRCGDFSAYTIMSPFLILFFLFLWRTLANTLSKQAPGSYSWSGPLYFSDLLRIQHHIMIISLKSTLHAKRWRDKLASLQFSSVAQSCPTLRPHESQHARLPCPSPFPGGYSNSCPLSRWCHPTVSSSVIPFSSCLQSFPASGSFQMSQLFTSGGQSIGVSALASFLPKNTQDRSPLERTGWISTHT